MSFCRRSRALFTEKTSSMVTGIDGRRSTIEMARNCLRRRMSLLFRHFGPPKATIITFPLNDLGQLFVGHYFFFEMLFTIVFFSSLCQSYMRAVSQRFFWGMAAVSIFSFIISIITRPHIVQLSQIVTDFLLFLTSFGFVVAAVNTMNTLKKAADDLKSQQQQQQQQGHNNISNSSNNTNNNSSSSRRFVSPYRIMRMIYLQAC